MLVRSGRKDGEKEDGVQSKDKKCRTARSSGKAEMQELLPC